MKYLMWIAIFFVSTQTFANEYSLKEICSKDVKQREAFSGDLRDKIVENLKGMKRDSSEWKLFVDSDMYEWLVLTYPQVLPSFAARPSAEACAIAHINYLNAENAKDAKTKLSIWKDCIATAYQDTPPEMYEALLRCYEPKKH